MRRRIMTLLLAAALLGSLLPQLTLPVRADASGTCGLNAEWHYDEGSNILNIYGTGAMYDWTDAGWHWEGVPTSVASIVIGVEITSIGENAFSGCTAAVELSLYNPDCGFPEVLGLPLTATIYGYAGSTAQTYAVQSGYRFGSIDSQNWAFDETTGVLYIYTDAGMAQWMEERDNYRSEVLEAHILEGVTSIPMQAFSFCTNMTEITIPSSVASIGHYPFLGCDSLASILVDSENPYFSSEDEVLFNHDRTKLILCTEAKLGEYTIPDTVTEIEQHAFLYCDGIWRITIPSSLTYFETNTIDGCDSLIEFEVDPQNQYYSSVDGVLFNQDQTRLVLYPTGRFGAYEIPDGVTSIGENAFFGCRGLTGVTIPDSVTSIDFCAFCNCHSLTELPIPDSVTSVYASAISYCDNLTHITFPDSVTYIGAYALQHCDKLSTVIIQNPDCVIDDGADTLNNPEITTIFGYPGSTAEAYAVQYGYEFLPISSVPYTFDEETGTLTIWNDDGMKNWSNYLYEANLLDPFNIKTVHIMQGVASIPDNSFSSCLVLEEVTIPSSVASIGICAFADCENLASVSVDPDSLYLCCEDGVIFSKDKTALIVCAENKTGAYGVPFGVSEIEQYAFYNRGGLTEITLSESLESIGELAFCCCSGLTQMTIPETVESLGFDVFYDCTGLTEINVDPQNPQYSSVDGVVFNQDQTTLILYPPGRAGAYEIPNGVTKIDYRSFFRCGKLTGLTIPNSVTAIESIAFYQCTGLTELTIPESVTFISRLAFYGCSSLTSITILNRECSIYQEASSLGPKDRTTVYGYTGSTAEAYAQTYGYNFEPLPGPPWEYDEATGTLYVYRDEALTDEGLFAETFYYTGNITTVHFMEGVTHLPPYSIAWHPELTEVTISSTVTDIEDIFCFCGCTGLVSIVVDPDNPSYSSEGCVLFDRDKTELILCAEGIAGTYTVPEGVVSIGDHAFYNCAGLTEIVLPESLGSVGDLAFDGCSGITSITIPASVASIGEDAFTNCANLAAYLVDPQNACYSSDGGILFDKDKTYLIHCPPRKTGAYTIPDSVTEIGDRAFAGCAGLTSVTIPDSVTEIGDRVFAGCTGLMSVTIPDSVTDVGRQAFWSCTGLTSVTIPENVTGVGEEAFHFCNNLTSVTILNPGCEIFPGSTTLNDPSITTVHGYAGSTAQTYAETYGYPFVPLEPVGYRVLFDANGGEGEMAAQTIAYDTYDDLTANAFYRTGYSFNGWNTEADGSGRPYTNGMRVRNLTDATEITLYAQWKPRTYIVRYNANGGSGALENQKGTYDAPLELRENTFTRTGYSPAGWNTAANGSGDAYNSGGTAVNLTAAAAITLYAQWTPNGYTIAFDANGGEGVMADLPMTYGVYTALTQNTFTRTGYAFNGWNTAADGSGTAYPNKRTVRNLATGGTVVLYAQWKPNAYTIRYSANGGSGSIENQKATYDEPIALRDNRFIRAGYAPAGWNTAANGSGTAYDGGQSAENLAVSGTVTLYAQWSPNSYTVAFDANGGTGEMDDQPMTYGVYAALTQNAFIRTGYSFTGWNTVADGSGTAYPNGRSVKNLATEGTAVLYAQWKPNTYTIQFLVNGGSGTTVSQKATYDLPTVLTANTFTRTGYSFAGWNTAADGSGTPFIDAQPVTNLAVSGSFRLYAQWSPNSYTVAFDPNGGAGEMAEQPMTYGVYAALTENAFTRTGYTFNGWNTAADGSGTAYPNKRSVKNLAPNGTVTLYAQWKPNTITVRFYPNGGTGTMENQKLTYGVLTPLNPNEFTREGYTFAGWKTAAGATYTDTQEVESLAPSGTVNLFAQWTR